MRFWRPRRRSAAGSRGSCTTRRAPRSVASSSASQRSTEGRRSRRRGQASAALQETAKTTLENIGRLAFDLRPSTLDDFGLWRALKALGKGLEEQGGPEVKLKVDLATAARLPASVETALFRITQEA